MSGFPKAFGVLLFDDDLPTAGWAAEGGNAYRFTRIDEISDEVLWWSNLSVVGYAKLLGAYQHIKPIGYLPTDLSALQNELGLVRPYKTQQAAATTLSEIFARVMRTANDAYGVCETPDFASFTKLADPLTLQLAGVDKPIGGDIDAAMRLAHENITFCIAKSEKHSYAYRFRRPRIEHALDVLRVPIPTGDWRFHNDDSIPRQRRVAFLVDLRQPVLAHGYYDQVDAAFAEVVNYGASVKSDRQFICQPDLLVLSRFAKVAVSGAFVAETYTNLTTRLPLELARPVGPLSISIGLLTEACLVALMQRSPPRTQSAIKDAHRLTTPRSVWLTAADRFHCMSAALQFHTFGFTVTNYGAGQVTVQVPVTRAIEACKLSSLIGFVPPLVLQEEAARLQENFKGAPFAAAIANRDRAGTGARAEEDALPQAAA